MMSVLSHLVLSGLLHNNADLHVFLSGFFKNVLTGVVLRAVIKAAYA